MSNMGMSGRIPPSLKWLIDKRARLDGEIQKIKASMAEAHKLISELSVVEQDLEAIDRALRMHEIQVETDLIKPIKSHHVRINVPYGELTRAILLRLRLAEGEPVSTDELASFVAARFASLEAPAQDSKLLRQSVRYRLKALAADQVVRRHHDKTGAQKAYWSIDSNITLPQANR